MDPLLSAEKVKAYYFVREGAVRAVDGVDLDVRQNEILGIAGESGCGKTTLVHTLMMNVRPPLRLVEGRIVVDGIEISKMDRGTLKREVWGVKISLVPQAAMNSLMPTMRLIDFIRDVLGHRMGISDAEIVSMAKRRLEELNLPEEVLYMYPHELSGGMRQRAVITVSTLLNPKLLIADEPTSALDVSTQKQVLKTLLDLKRAGIVNSIVFVSHDIAVLRQIADRMVVMYAGKIVEVGRTEDLIFRPVHPYTKLLVHSVVTPEPEIRKRGLAYIPGEPPSLLKPPSGCRFHPRCPYAVDRCSRLEPPLVDVGGDRRVACHLFPEKGGANA